MLSTLDSASFFICLVFNAFLVGLLSAIMLSRKKYADEENVNKRPLLDNNANSMDSIDVGDEVSGSSVRPGFNMPANISAIGGSTSFIDFGRRS